MLALTDLLSPTWEKRKHAEQQLFNLCIEHSPAEISQWLTQEINQLPNPILFLQTLIVFWGDIQAKQYQQRMQDSHLAISETQLAWAKSITIEDKWYAAETLPSFKPFHFELTGLGIVELIKHLGFIAPQIEATLLACMNHAEPAVQLAGEIALGNSEHMSEKTFIAFWQNLATRSDDHPQRRSLLGKHITLKRLPLLIEAIEHQRPHNTRWQTYPAELALSCLPFTENTVAKTAHDYLQQHLTHKRTPILQASYLHALTKLSQQHGFQQTIADFCQNGLQQNQLLEESDKDQLNAAYVDYLSAYHPAQYLIPLAAIQTPWALSTLCQNLATAPSIPLALLVTTIQKSLGNYDGFDGMPHCDAVSLLLSQTENAIQCRYSIIAWWYQVCQNSLTQQPRAN